MFKTPRQYLISGHAKQAWFHIPQSNPRDLLVVCVHINQEWERVSVSKKYEMPSVGELYYVKSLFWSDDDVVIQFYAASGNGDAHSNYALHLWRPVNKPFPVPYDFLMSGQNHE